MTDLISQEFVEANIQISTSLYKETIKTTENNILISPLATQVALATCQSAASGPTANEIKKTLRLGEKKATLEKTFKNLTSTLKSSTLNTFNKFYVSTDSPLNDVFKNTASEAFGVEMENINLALGVEDTAKTINKWWKNKIGKNIVRCIDPEDVQSDCKIILISSLYFKGDWCTGFKSSTTCKREFSKTNKEIVEIATMTCVGEYKYLESSKLKAQFLEIPFRDKDTSMVFILPIDKTGIEKLEKNIEKVLLQSLSLEIVQVFLPKFRVSCKTDLKKILCNIGVKKVFNQKDANLGLFLADSNDRIPLSAAVQRVVLEVNEAGVEMSSDSSCAMGSKNLVEVGQRKVFNADHPFLYYLKIRSLVVFVGRVASPL